jgi:glycerol-3-phosphate dehydrogenase (NAD(P)+)
MARPSRTATAVLGAGSFGTALAVHLARLERPTFLWGRNAAHLKQLEAERTNAEYLPGVRFPQGLQVASGLDSVIAVPSHALHEVLDVLAAARPDEEQGIVCACKGLEPGTGRLPHEVVKEVFGTSHPLAVLSGPTFAKDIGQGSPTGVTVASPDPDYAEHVAHLFHGGGFRAYTSDDIVGVEVGGAVKNVLAIAVGAADGLGLGANTRTVLITRGLAEIMRLGEALGANRDTLMGLSGIGDLVLTCTDNQSRNRRFGLAIAQGKSVEQALAEIKQVVEGVRVAPEVLRRAKQLEVEMPITEQVVAVLSGKVSPLEALKILATRPSRAEMD